MDDTSQIRALCVDGSTLFINTSRITLSSILENLKMIPSIYDIQIIDTTKGSDGCIYELHIQYTLGGVPTVTLKNAETGELLQTRYVEHPIIEYVLNRYYNSKTIH